MGNKFKDKSVKIVAVDPSASGRQTLTEFFKKLGFSNVHSVSNLKNVLEALEVEPDSIDWVIGPLQPDSLENGLSLLKVATLIPTLKNVRISLLLEESEKYCLPTAFELGLLSWHRKPFTKDSLQEDFEQLLAFFAANDWSVPLTAAEYIRQIFRESKSYKGWIPLEKNLLKLFPGNPRLLLNIAEPLFHLDKKPAALATLKQVLMIDPSLEKEVASIRGQFVTKDQLEGIVESVEDGVNILGIGTVVVVDPDESIQTSLKNLLLEAGVDRVEFFADGLEAAKYIKENPNPGLVFQEWRIPKISGPAFLQRIIAEGAPTSPIIVLSSLVKSSDMAIVKEMGVANILEKPFDRQNLLRNLVSTMQEERSPHDVATMERKIRKLLRVKNIAEATVLIAKFLLNPTVRSGNKKLIEAEFAYANGNYTTARDLCVESIKMDGDSINALNLLGKSMMQLRDFEPALKCLKKAQDFSPMNIERLCHIAEAEAEIGEQEAAVESIDDAKDLDSDSAKVKQTEVNVALIDGDTAKAQALMANLDSFEDIVSYMNNKAVALSRCGMHEEGLGEYKKTVQALPENQSDLRSRIHYNMALGYARASELELALKELEAALLTPSPKIRAKAISLQARLEQAIKRGTAFELVASPTEAPPTPTLNNAKSDAPPAENDDELKISQNELLISGLLAERGEIACFMLFNNPEPPTAETTELLAKLPRFQHRKTIERKESINSTRGK